MAAIIPFIFELIDMGIEAVAGSELASEAAEGISLAAQESEYVPGFVKDVATSENILKYGKEGAKFLNKQIGQKVNNLNSGGSVNNMIKDMNIDKINNSSMPLSKVIPIREAQNRIVPLPIRINDIQQNTDGFFNIGFPIRTKPDNPYYGKQYKIDTVGVNESPSPSDGSVIWKPRVGIVPYDPYVSKKKALKKKTVKKKPSKKKSVKKKTTKKKTTKKNKNKIKYRPII